MTSEARYTTQFQAGLGMIPETLDLLRVWEPGMIPARLAELVISEGLFARTTARRARNLVAEMFAPRFLAEGGLAAARLKFLLEQRTPLETLIQLFFVYTSRAQRILGDFVIESYWPKYSAGASTLNRTDAENFVRRALDSGRMVTRWSESTVKRVSGYLLGCCEDFGLLAPGGRNDRAIQRFSIRPDVALYLCHDLHFAGVSDNAIVRHPDWRLFGYEPTEVLRQLKRLAQDGYFIVQSSGDLVQLSWKFRTMNDFLNALTQK